MPLLLNEDEEDTEKKRNMKYEGAGRKNRNENEKEDGHCITHQYCSVHLLTSSRSQHST